MPVVPRLIQNLEIWPTLGWPTLFLSLLPPIIYGKEHGSRLSFSVTQMGFLSKQNTNLP
jgi:hypothetical protein